MDDEPGGPGCVRRVVLAFNDAITRQDLTSLSQLMTDDHAFIDSDDNVLRGRERVLDAWSGFFDAFPDYRNVWTSLISADDLLIAIGRSVCASEPRLDGPAIWTAKTRGGRVAEWRVSDDTPENRARLGVGPTEGKSPCPPSSPDFPEAGVAARGARPQGKPSGVWVTHPRRQPPPSVGGLFLPQ